MITAPRGTRDIRNGEVEKWRYVEYLAHEVCAAFGYRELRTPLFEYSELFARLGEATDLVQKETYTFEDRGGRSLTLRPEGTAAVARAYLEHGLDRGPQPVKMYYLGPMFRYERPQSGRYRQHHQFGAELIGAEGPGADAEVIGLAIEYYRRLGLDSLRLDLNSIGCPDCRPTYRDELSSFLDRVEDDLCGDCKVRRTRNVLRVLDCKERGCRDVLESAPRAGAFLCSSCQRHHDDLLVLLDSAGIRYQHNERLVRGLDYYTRTVFEVVSTALGADRALGGGGRYDGLVKELGGKSVPGVGFGLGIERLLLTLEEEGRLLPTMNGLEVYVVALGDEAWERAWTLVSELRRRGVACDIDHLRRSMKAQMKQADRMRARIALIIGEQEVAGGQVLLRDMNSGEQRQVELNRAVQELVGDNEGA